jgi:hypothetical protein
MNGIVQKMLMLLKGEAHRYPIAMRADHRTAQNHDRPRAAATSVHEPYTQRNRSHEGLGLESFGSRVLHFFGSALFKLRSKHP